MTHSRMPSAIVIQAFGLPTMIIRGRVISPRILNALDLKAAVDSVRAMREVMARESLVPVIDEVVEPGPAIQSDAEIGEWVKRVATTMWHLVGTCRMGKDDRAVVDARLRVRGVKWPASLTDDQRRDVAQRRKDGAGVSVLSRAFKTSRQTIMRIRDGASAA
jgi:hypothetical protein